LTTSVHATAQYAVDNVSIDSDRPCACDSTDLSCLAFWRRLVISGRRRLPVLAPMALELVAFASSQAC
jgi:hypothetical protein